MNITDPKFQWTSAAQTDIRRTFARFGWVGPEAKRMAETLQAASERQPKEAA